MTGPTTLTFPGLTDERRAAVVRDGFTLLPGHLDAALLDEVRAAFDQSRVDIADGVKFRLELLRYPALRKFMDTPRILAPVRAFFGDQLQLIELFGVYQPPAKRFRTPADAVRGERDWHRDFGYVVAAPDTPLMITMLVYLDGIDERTGPTVVLPRTHLAQHSPVRQHSDQPHPDEVAVPVAAGDVLLFNSTLVHSRGRNRAAHTRRALVINFSYWWMKQFEHDMPLVPEATVDATEDRLRLLGLRQPGYDIYI